MDEPHAGFYCTPNDWIRKHGPDLGPYGIAVYHCLMSFADQDGICWPSYQTIANLTGMSRPTVIKTIAKLIDLGILSKAERRKGQRQSSNSYHLTSKAGLPHNDLVVNYVKWLT